MNAAARSIDPAVPAPAAGDAGKAKTVAATKRRRQPWKPTARDEMVVRWIKFEGMTQHWVAEQMGISQATVSRVVQRYERWQAHAQERERGQLDHAERLRAQFWMTYERNELILASALRIAGEMERFAEVSKSTTRRPQHDPEQQKEISTQTAMVDRSGVAARFLRLAFRVNMEQLKLTEREPLPPLAPLAEGEHEELECDAEWQAREAHEGREGEEAVEERCRERPPWRSEEGEATQEPATASEESTWRGSGVDGGPSPCMMESCTPPTTPDPVVPPESEELNVHNLHKGIEPEFDASAHGYGTCDNTTLRKKSRRYARLAPPRPRPQRDDSTDELRVIGADEEAAPQEPALSRS